MKVIWFKKRYGNDPAGGNGEGGEGGANGGAGGAGGSGGAEKKFTQDDVDRILNKRFAKEKSEKEQLLKQLTTLQDTAKLTEEERTTLESQIQSLTDSLQTKEQQQALAAKKLEEKYTKERDAVASERDLWKNRYVDSTIKRSLTDAAVASNAQEPAQIVMMFGHATSLEEQLDSAGKPTGEFVPVMKFQGIDPETKKPAQMKLPVSEAIAHMRENGLHKNLFKHTGTPGTGEGGTGTGKGKDNGKMPTPSDYASPELFQDAYQKWRDGHKVDGSTIKA